jgi:uncharacterized RDD family membrane protein YckC
VSASTPSWQAPESEAGPAPGLSFAPHGQRLLAWILDGILLSLVLLLISAVAWSLFISGAEVSGGRVVSLGPGAIPGALLFVLGFFVGLLYFPFFWARGGRTPGMRPFGLRVVRDADGGPIDWPTALLRLVGLWVAAFVFYLGFVWIFIDKRRRGWQDLIAGTIVVKPD